MPKVTFLPDGNSVDVEGRVVWSEANKAYGVQFNDAAESVKDTMFGWTRRLVRQD